MAPIKAILANTTTQIGHHGCTLVNRRIDALAAHAGIEIVARLPAHVPSTMLARISYDAIIVNGEGSLHHDKRGAQAIAELAVLARTLGRPAYLINSVYEANSAKLSKNIRQFQRIWVRDTTSARAAALHDIDVDVVPDLTLTWQAPPPLAGAHSLVIIDSTQSTARHELHALASALAAPYMSLKAPPPVLSDYPDHNAKRRAIFACKRAIAYVAPRGQWRDTYRNIIPDFDAFITWLSSHAQLLVTGRFHGLCLALDLEIPVLAMASNTSKVQALLADMGLESRLLTDIGAFRERYRHEGIESFRFEATELARIRAFKHSAVKRAEAMFAQIAQDARFLLSPRGGLAARL